MGKVICGVLSLAVLTTAAWGELGDVVASWTAPASSPYGVAANASYIYVYCGTSPYNVYTMTTAGSVVSSWSSPFGSRTRGLGYEYGNYLWLGYYGSGVAFVAKTNGSNGSVISSFPVYNEHTLYGGVACQGNPSSAGVTSIISNDYLPYVASRHTTAGSLISTFVYSTGEPSFRDPAWDYVNGLIWWGDYYSPYFVYGYDTDGSIVASFAGPWVSPYGLGFYGDYLWISSNSSPYYVYRVHCPFIGISVVPASVGKVKALFR
jgi:hypothetical protein